MTFTKLSLPTKSNRRDLVGTVTFGKRANRRIAECFNLVDAATPHSKTGQGRTASWCCDEIRVDTVCLNNRSVRFRSNSARFVLFSLATY